MDVNRNAFRIVHALTDENKHETPRSAAARIGGRAGGSARAKSLSASRRREIAQKASRSRWEKRDGSRT